MFTHVTHIDTQVFVSCVCRVLCCVYVCVMCVSCVHVCCICVLCMRVKCVCMCVHVCVTHMTHDTHIHNTRQHLCTRMTHTRHTHDTCNYRHVHRHNTQHTRHMPCMSHAYVCVCVHVCVCVMCVVLYV